MSLLASNIACLRVAWKALSRWEEVEPVEAGMVFPGGLLRAAITVSMAWGWHVFRCSCREERLRGTVPAALGSKPLRDSTSSCEGGKIVLIQNLILNVYRNSFARIFIFSPSVHNDPTFTEVKKYIRDELQVDDEKEQIYFDNYNPSDLENVIERQKKIINYMKSKKIKKLHSILIVIDDHADDPKFVRYSKLLHGLFTRGRHDAVSVICSTQKYNVLAPIIRLNASS